MNSRNAALVAAVVWTAGCGDQVGDVGDLGRLTYGLHIDYEIDGRLREQKLVTGHTQILDIELTKKGEKQSRHPGLIEHKLSPAAGTEVLFDPGDEDDNDPPAAWITVDAPGSYVLESWLEGELFDALPLEFGTPARLDVRTQIRPPGSDSFDTRTDDKEQLVAEGTQVAFLTIPLDKKGDRLVGQYEVAVSWTPEWAAIQTYNVLGVYENEGVFGSLAEHSLVFIDPATVTVDLIDVPNGMTDQVVFEVYDNGQ